MKIHESKGIVFILGNASEPDREDELNDWLVNSHFAEVLAPGRFVEATRLGNAAAAGDEGSPRFATIYETQRPDVAAAWKENMSENAERRKQGLITPLSPASSTPQIGAFRRVALHGERAASATGVFAVMIDVAAADWPEFQVWYDEVHIPDILGTGLYHAAVRYENDGPLEDGEPQYLTLYLTDRDDPVAVQRQFEASLQDLRQAPRNFDLTMRFWGSFAVMDSVSRSDC